MRKLLLIAIFSILLISLYAQTPQDVADKCWIGLKSSKCILCRATFNSKTLVSTFGLMMRKGTLSTQKKGDKVVVAGDDDAFKCYPNTESLSYTCQQSPIDKCEIYDYFGRCIRCGCDYAFKVDAAKSTNLKGGIHLQKTCIENQLRVVFCDEYNLAGQCIRCKWNQPPNDEYNSWDATPEQQKDVFTDAERLFLDYGLYKGICYNNQAWTKEVALPLSEGAAIKNCMKYDDGSEGKNLKCVECHSRWFNFYSNNEWTVPDTKKNFNDVLRTYQKIHFDYFLSTDDTGKTTCERYPTHFVGFPKDLKLISYATDEGAIQINPSKAKCQQSQIFLNLCGLDLTTAANLALNTKENCQLTDATEYAIKNKFVLCATSIANCKQYDVQTILKDRRGDQSDAPLYTYYTATKCKVCSDLYMLNMDGTQCVKIETAFDNNNCLQTASTDYKSCKTCKAGTTMYLISSADKATITSSSIYKCGTTPNGASPTAVIENCQLYYKKSSDNANWYCARCKVGWTRQKINANVDQACIFIGTKLFAAQTLSYLFGCGKFSDDINGNKCETGTASTDGACHDGFSVVSNPAPATGSICSCNQLAPDNQLVCTPDAMCTGTACINFCARYYSQSYEQCIVCSSDGQIRADSWKECIQTISADNLNCVAYTSNGACRLCKIGFFLEKGTQVCVADKKDGDNKYDNTQCSFGSYDKKTPANKPVCEFCNRGYTLTTTTTQGVSTTECKANAKLESGEICKTYASINSYCSDCQVGKNETWVVTLTADSKSMLERKCAPIIANCLVVDSSQQACMQCGFYGTIQWGVKADGTCQACAKPNQLGLNYDGKQVCVITLDDNCRVYDFEGYCTECKVDHYLVADGRCLLALECTKIDGFQNIKLSLFNNYKAVDGCLPSKNNNFDQDNSEDSRCQQWAINRNVGTNLVDKYICQACKPSMILKPVSALQSDISKVKFQCYKFEGEAEGQKHNVVNANCNIFDIKYNAMVSTTEVAKQAICDNSVLTTDTYPICKPKDMSSPVISQFASDFGFICAQATSGVLADCVKQCIDNTGGVPNCFSYFKAAKQDQLLTTGVKDKCCACKPGFIAGGGDADTCTIKTCTQQYTNFCEITDNNDQCSTCQGDNLLYVQKDPKNDKKFQRICKATCDNTETKVSIFNGYAIKQGCIKKDFTGQKYNFKGEIATCSTFYFEPYTEDANGAATNNVLSCMKCATNKILQPSKDDATIYECVDISSKTQILDANCLKLNKAVTGDDAQECRFYSFGDVIKSVFNEDYGLKCIGTTADDCVKKCDTNQYKNCKTYISTTQKFSKQGDTEQKCCQCKANYAPETVDNDCKIDACNPKCDQFEKDGDTKLCKRCADGYALKLDRTCVTETSCKADANYDVTYGLLTKNYETVKVCLALKENGNIKFKNYKLADKDKQAIFTIPDTKVDDLIAATSYDKVFLYECPANYILSKTSTTQWECVSVDVGANASPQLKNCRYLKHQCDVNTRCYGDNGYICQGPAGDNCIQKCLSNTGMVPNCQRYKTGSVLTTKTCCACQTGYIPTFEGGAEGDCNINKCAESPCKTFDVKGKCAECISTHYLTPSRTCIPEADCTTGSVKILAETKLRDKLYLSGVKFCFKTSNTLAKYTQADLTQDRFCQQFNIEDYSDEKQATFDNYFCIQCPANEILQKVDAKYTCKADPVDDKYAKLHSAKGCRATDIDVTTTDVKCNLAYPSAADPQFCKLDSQGFKFTGTESEWACADNADLVVNCDLYGKLDTAALDKTMASATNCCKCKKGYRPAADTTTCNIEKCVKVIDVAAGQGQANFDKVKVFADVISAAYCASPTSTANILTLKGECTTCPLGTTAAKVQVINSGFKPNADQYGCIPNAGWVKTKTLKYLPTVKADDSVDFDKDNCAIWEFDATNKWAADAGDLLQVGCTQCKENYILGKVGTTYFTCIFSPDIATSCQAKAAKDVCNEAKIDGTGTQIQQPCSQTTTSDYQFLPGNVNPGQCASTAAPAVKNCATYFKDSSNFDLSALSAAKCCGCKNGYKGDKNDCTITSCTDEKDNCVSYAAGKDKAGNAGSICQKCRPGFALTLKRECIDKATATCEDGNAGKAKGQFGQVKISNYYDLVDACTAKDQSDSADNKFISTTTDNQCAAFSYPDDADSTQNYNILLCAGCKKGYILYRTKKYGDVFTQWRCVKPTDISEDNTEGARFKNVPTKYTCDEYSKFNCNSGASDTTIDFAYAQEKSTGIGKCLDNTQNGLIPRCRQYYLPTMNEAKAITGDGTSVDILTADGLAALKTNCKECQKGYKSVLSTDGKKTITSCIQKCLIWDKSERFCLTCPLKKYLTVDGDCVDGCDGYEKYAWTGYYTAVPACSIKSGSSDTFQKLPKENDCEIWDFRAAQKDIFDTTKTADFKKATCYSCSGKSMMAKYKSDVSDNNFICMNVNNVNDLDMSDNFCSAIDTTSPTAAARGHCIQDSCRNMTQSVKQVTDATEQLYYTTDYGFFIDSTVKNLKRCVRNGDKKVKYCLTYVYFSGNSQITSNELSAGSDFSTKCCQCKAGFWPEYVTGTTSGCNIKKCSRHSSDLYNTDDTIVERKKNCQSYQFDNLGGKEVPNVNCAFCKPGYFSDPKDSTNCVELKKATPGCKTVELDGDYVCSQCHNPMVIARPNGDNQCYPKTLYCISYTGATKTVNGVTSVECSNCEYPYYIDKTNNRCLLKPAGCKTMITKPDATTNEWDELRPKCEECLENWYFYENQCYFGCARVQTYFNADSKKYDKFCCTCQSGFRMKDSPNLTGQCEACTDVNCATCSGTIGTCTLCKTNYYLSAGTCSIQTELKPPCGTYDPNNKDKCSTCKTDPANAKKPLQYFDKTVSLCKDYSDDILCDLFDFNNNYCSVCKTNAYFDSQSKKCIEYVKTTTTKCSVFSKVADECLVCNKGTDGLATNAFWRKNGVCTNEQAITNCIEYDQNQQSPVCVKCDSGTNPASMGFGLSSDNKQCLDNTLLKEGGTPHCFKYLSASSGTAPECETCGTIQNADSYVLVANETKKELKCQQISYCQAAVLQRSSLSTTKEVYKCTKCLEMFGTGPVIHLILASKEKGSTDKGSQCVLLASYNVGVRQCKKFKLTNGAVEKDYEDNCVECFDGYSPESQLNVDGTIQGGKMCKPKDLLCEQRGCLSYQLNTNYEWVRCRQCDGNYSLTTDSSPQMLGLNSQSLTCDILTITGNDGGTFPDQNVKGQGGTGADGGVNPGANPNVKPSDGGTNPTPNPNPNPTPNNNNKFGKINSFGFETLLIIILGFVAMII